MTGCADRRLEAALFFIPELAGRENTYIKGAILGMAWHMFVARQLAKALSPNSSSRSHGNAVE